MLDNKEIYRSKEFFWPTSAWNDDWRCAGGGCRRLQRLMGLDEERTHSNETFRKTRRRSRIRRTFLVAIVKNTGDGMLVDSASVCRCGACALDIRERCQTKRPACPPELGSISYGIHVGDSSSPTTLFFGDGSTSQRAAGVASQALLYLR